MCCRFIKLNTTKTYFYFSQAHQELDDEPGEVLNRVRDGVAFPFGDDEAFRFRDGEAFLALLI